MSDTREELQLDEWIQENMYTCSTCKYRPGYDPLCEDCEGQNWAERDWAEYRKKIIQANMKHLTKA